MSWRDTTPTNLALAQGTYDRPAFDQQEAGKVSFSDPNVPVWVKYGFGNTPEGEAAYRSIYERSSTTTAPPSTTSPATPGAPATYGSFADYLAANPGSVDAWEYLDNLLKGYGLGDLTKFAQDQIQQGRSDNEILQRLRETDTYKNRFPAIVESQRRGLPAVSEAEVISYEKQLTQVMQSAGLPAGFFDQPEDFAKFITNGISVAEADRRINQMYAEVSKRPDLIQEWQALGYGTGDLVAHFLDPDRTEALLTKQFSATQRAAEAQRAGFGQLSTSEAENLATLDIPAGQVQEGFNTLVKSKELFGGLPGEHADNITREQQLGATFGNDATSQEKIQKRAETRKAVFGGGGSFTQGQDGRTGVGTAR